MEGCPNQNRTPPMVRRGGLNVHPKFELPIKFQWTCSWCGNTACKLGWRGGIRKSGNKLGKELREGTRMPNWRVGKPSCWEGLTLELWGRSWIVESLAVVWRWGSDWRVALELRLGMYPATHIPQIIGVRQRPLTDFIHDRVAQRRESSGARDHSQLRHTTLRQPNYCEFSAKLRIKHIFIVANFYGTKNYRRLCHLPRTLSLQTLGQELQELCFDPQSFSRIHLPQWN